VRADVNFCQDVRAANMRALVISDVHGNIDALRALELQWGGRLAAFKHVICLGDLVDYGPDPRDVIEWVRARATHVVGGNHDHAMSTGEPCRSSPAYLEASIATRRRLLPTLTRSDLEYLHELPERETVTIGTAAWDLIHATPADPLYQYLPPGAPEDQWRFALEGQAGESILAGHTHMAFVRAVAGGLFVNPGSIGMPKDGSPHGSYAVIHDGAVQFQRIVYDPEPMIRRLRALDLPEGVFDQLARVFGTGEAPE